MTRKKLRELIEADDILLTGIAHKNALRRKLGAKVVRSIQEHILDKLELYKGFSEMEEEPALMIAYWEFYTVLAKDYGILLQ